MLYPKIKNARPIDLNIKSSKRMSQRYLEWKRYIKNRDASTCQFPKCGSDEQIQVHHIQRYADKPSLRHQTINGICLCKKCHNFVTGRERFYQLLFFNIAKKNEDEYNTRHEGK